MRDALADPEILEGFMRWLIVMIVIASLFKFAMWGVRDHVALQGNCTGNQVSLALERICAADKLAGGNALIRHDLGG